MTKKCLLFAFLFCAPDALAASRATTRPAMQPLESRTHLSVSLDANGWTAVTPSADSRVIYVSSSTGNDNNSGLSATTPVASLAKGLSLLRANTPDWLLLKRGDTWQSNFGIIFISGRSAQEPVVISSYGDSTQRPLIDSGTSSGLQEGSPADNYVDIIGLHFRSLNDAPSGIAWLGGSTNVLFEDNYIEGYTVGVNLHGINGTPQNVSLRRNIIANNYATAGNSEGIYADTVAGLTLEGNIFDHNGWQPGVPSTQTIFNHNAYIKENVTGFVARGNIFANASSHGLQARSGGDIENNLFINNPIGLSFGLVAGSPVTAGGVSGTVAGNVFIGDRDINGATRGWAMEISNIKPNSGTSIHDNVIADDTQNAFAAIQLSAGGGVSNPADAVGINDLTINNNLVYHWYQDLWINPIMVPGGTGQYALNNLTVQNNDFQQPLSSIIVTHGPAYSSVQEHWLANRYYDSANPAGWFTIANATTSWNTWHTNVDSTGAATQVAYPDPSRTVATYDSSLGGTGTVDDFLATAEQMSKLNWNPSYTSLSAINYIRQGFGLAPIGAVAAQAGILITPATALTTTEAGGTATFNMALATQPTADVTITLTSSNPAQGSLSATSLVFTAANWNTPQSITVTGLDDHIVNGNVQYSITTAASSADPSYNGLQGPTLTVTNVEADKAGIDVTPTTPLTTTETGGSAIFQVALNSEPVANVTVPLALSDTNPATLSASSLTFTPTNWNIPQNVTVSGQMDSVADGDVPYQVNLGPAVSTDLVYSGFAGPSLSLVNQDNDFSSSAYIGNIVNWQPLTASRWSLASDAGDARYFLNTSAYSAAANGALGEYSLLKGLSFGDFTYSLQAKSNENLSTNTAADYAVVFGYVNANNYSFLSMTANSPAVLYSVTNGSRKTIARSRAASFTDNNYHAIQITRSGSTVTVLRDGVQILAASNSRLSAAGAVGVGSLNDSAYFDEINVTAPTGALQPAAKTTTSSSSTTWSTSASQTWGTNSLFNSKTSILGTSGGSVF